MRRRGMNGRTFSPNPRKRRRSHHHHHHLLSPFANAHNASDSLELRFKPTTMYRLSNAGNWYMYKVTFDQEAQTTRSGVRWEEYHWLLWPQLNDNVLHSNTLSHPPKKELGKRGGGVSWYIWQPCRTTRKLSHAPSPRHASLCRLTDCR